MAAERERRAVRRDATSGKRGKAGPSTGQDFVGDALRAAFQETVDEDIPDEFSDLLGKLA